MKKEADDIHQRIGLLVDHFCKGNKTAFGRETDILPGVLASIIGGRMSKPSFELLQKIMFRYPEVSGDWLIIGRGPMTHPSATDERPEQARRERRAEPRELTATETQALVNAVKELYFNDEEMRQRTGEQLAAQMATKRIDNEILTQMYTFGGTSQPSAEYPIRRLSERLGFSEEETAKRIYSGEIPVIKVSNEEGYRISEQSVRDYIASSSGPFIHEKGSQT